MEEKVILMRDSKAFYFYFDWPTDPDENLKHEIECIIKSNESLAENKIKNDIEHGSNIHEHGKQQNE